MPLSPGTRLGPYEIVAALGAGGMGEVYTASDPRLGRLVAIKVISRGFASDPGRLRRFEQEARAAAAVSHPALLAVHDIGVTDGQPFIVSELLEGTTLRDRITTDGMPASRALALALQMAQGLAAAHAKGVIHRDLKPENIFVTADGRAKILDFGLAKLSQAEPAEASATMTALATDTQPGLVLGTIGYMAPEQLRGLAADARADIFAFGAILYEMLSGRRAFAGETMADTMSAILTKEPPDIASSIHAVPAGLQQILRHCLEKSPEQRFQSARDLAFALEAVSTTSGSMPIATLPAAPAPVGARAWKIAAVSCGLVAVGLAVALLLRSRTNVADAPALFFSVIDHDLPGDAAATTVGFVSVSPDGRRIAVNRRETDRSRIWIVPLTGGAAAPLDGTTGVAPGAFTWSDDSRSIAFVSGGSLRRVDVETGTTQTICPAPGVIRPLDWSRTGVIIVARLGIGLQRVSDNGGALQDLRPLGTSQRDQGMTTGGFLPDGQHFVFTVQSRDPARAGVWVGSLDSQAPVRVIPDESPAMTFAPPGYLLTVRDNVLFARRFDPARFTASGPDVPVADSVGSAGGGRRGLYSTSAGGLLVFTHAGAESVQFSVRDASGRRVGTVGAPDFYGPFSVSPDGRQIAAQRREATSITSHVNVLDRIRGVSTLLTPGDASETDPLWSRDGQRLAFTSSREVGKGVYTTSPAGGAATRVGTIDLTGPGGIDAWSPDGRLILAHMPFKLLTLPVDGGAPVTIASAATTALDEAEWSPDGKFITYNNSDTGRSEVFAIPYPPTGERWQMSAAGGVQGRWSLDGRALFYLDLTGTLMRIDLPTGRPADASPPKAMFPAALAPSAIVDQYRVLPDGSFLIEESAGGPVRAAHTLILNWPTLVSQREHAR